MTEREKIIDRVRKLRAMAGSTSPVEAERARERVADLMRKHQITEGEVVSSAEVQIAEWPVEGVDFSADWRLALLTVIAMRYGCKALRIFEGRKKLGAVVGPKDAAEVIIQLFRYFNDEVSTREQRAWDAEASQRKEDNKEAREEWINDPDHFEPGEENDPVKREERGREFDEMMKSWGDEMDEDIRPDFQDSFCRGATIVLQDRILSGDLDVWKIWKDRGAEEKRKKDEEEEAARKKAAMIRVDPRAISKNLVNEHMKGKPRERFSGLSYAVDRDAFKLGKIAGADIPMPGMRQDVIGSKAEEKAVG